MKWFLVRYIYEIISGDGGYRVQFDEQLRLISADTGNDAICKAEGMADDFHPPFRNYKGELVEWKFICIAGLHEIQTPTDGAEVTSILHEPHDALDFRAQIDKRKEFLDNAIGVL
ncbi:DUF4288 domain-containing protein [Pedobacter frigoris]|uniref:DUF4288 domain-containing protein n=1 Tax=Pedobacter frigoris TaxID=2571272 RepID=A0A4V5NZZ9_9SPHI|nr:DUF4288 domain-containing protein [Pedobacter frigoris]TKC09022.1 DUF4288 domain-containing protein [Pedobacter frigoris]